MAMAPITEEDKPAVESMIKRLVRLRKRQVEHSSHPSTAEDLTCAIKSLQDFGALKGWWEHEETK